VPVPYANLTNPQTLNLYAMVADDAETYADLDGHCCDLDDAIDYGVGVLRGFASSLTFGAVGAPKSEDSVSSRAGQGTGTVLAGITGEITADAGKGGMVAGLAAEAPSLGTSTTLVLAGAGAAALGTVVEAGAAANLARLATTPIQSSGMAPKPGESGGPGAGKVFDAETKQAAKSENAAANGGEARCVYCGVKVTNEPGPNRVNVDHAVARANGGTNTLENAQVACQYCNQSKGTGSAPKTPRQLDQQPDVVDPGPTT